MPPDYRAPIVAIRAVEWRVTDPGAIDYGEMHSTVEVQRLYENAWEEIPVAIVETRPRPKRIDMRRERQDTDGCAPDATPLPHSPRYAPIGWAVEQLEAGEPVRRRKWEKGLYLRLTPRPGTRPPYIEYRTSHGEAGQWQCGQRDILAVDWEIAPDADAEAQAPEPEPQNADNSPTAGLESPGAPKRPDPRHQVGVIWSGDELTDLVDEQAITIERLRAALKEGSERMRDGIFGELGTFSWALQTMRAGRPVTSPSRTPGPGAHIRISGDGGGIWLCSAQERRMPWGPTPTDLLATDWQLMRE